MLAGSLRECGHDPFFAVRIKTGRRFIEQQELAGVEQCPCHGNALRLSDRQPRRMLTHKGMDTFRQGGNKFADIGLIHDPLHGLHAGVRVAEAQVVQNRRLRQMRVLSHPGNQLAP